MRRLAGHMLLNILAGFTYNIITTGVVYFLVEILPLAFVIALAGVRSYDCCNTEPSICNSGFKLHKRLS